MLAILRKLLGWVIPSRPEAPRSPSERPARKPSEGERPQRAEPTLVGSNSPWTEPDPLPDVRALDAPETSRMVVLVGRDSEKLLEVQERVRSGRLSLAQLPSTSVAIMELAAKPNSDVTEIVERLEPDPVLCSELLRTANSVLYATRVPTESVRDAVMRLGTRNLRTMVLGLSMRNSMIRSKALQRFGEKVWRQAFTVASIARAVAPDMRLDPDHAFLLGLLHDIGKVALLDTLSQVIEQDSDATPVLVGRMFLEFHEEAGRAMAETWGLDDELVSVAGCHHDFEANEDYRESAAFVALCHRMELLLSLDATEEFQEMAECAEFDALGVPAATRGRVLATALRTYLSLQPAPAEEDEADEAEEIAPAA